MAYFVSGMAACKIVLYFFLHYFVPGTLLEIELTYNKPIANFCPLVSPFN